MYVLSYEVARPHCKIPRANGQGHRTGTYIKQSFVGNIESYPTEWFGASEWNAHQKSENDYYLDNDPMLPEWPTDMQGGDPRFMMEASLETKHCYENHTPEV